MGKGDKKSTKGKRFKHSFGNARKRNAIVNRLKKQNPVAKPVAAPVAVAEEKPKPKRVTKKKAEAAE
jgi:ribosomal small subunit protein bTHX